MLSTITQVINKKTKIIPIINNLSNTNINEYGLKQNFFDPSKSSPPNEFMIKLKKRISIYNTNSYSHTKVDNLESE